VSSGGAQGPLARDDPTRAEALRMGTAQGRWVLTATVLGSGMALLDATVVYVALPRIGTDLGAGFAGLQWIVNGYGLALAALLLLGGSLGDRFGRRRVFMIGIGWFAAASTLCALAPDMGLLVAARVLQGVGAALLTPGSLAIISASFAERDRGPAVGAWSGLGGLAGAVGPLLGGVLIGWNWRAVFWVNLPVALVVLWVTAVHVPETFDAQAPPGLDLLGTALGVLGLGGITLGCTQADWSAGRRLCVIGAGLVALVVLVVAERRSPHPLVPGALFGSRRFLAANLVTLAVYAGLGVLFLLLPVQLQRSAGFSPLLAGAALLPVTAVVLLFSARAGRLARRIGPRLPMTLGPLLAAGGAVLLAPVGAGAGYLRDVLPGAVVLGGGLALTVAPLTTAALDAAGERLAGAASGVNNAVARTAGLLAVALVPTATGITGSAYLHPAALTEGFRHSMLAVEALLVVGGLLAALTIGQGSE
jgi:EmrB/QacA subfamily drug resistance transporter